MLFSVTIAGQERKFCFAIDPDLTEYLFTEKETQDRVLSKMIVPVMGKDPRWLLVEVCREFQRGKCSRTEDECRFAHPPTHVAIQNGKVTACFDSLKGRCRRDNCKYLHPPKHIKAQMENNGRLLQQQQQQQQLAFQQQAFAPLAQQMLTNPSFISTWPLSLPGSNGTYLQQPLAFLPDTSALAQTPSRRLDKSDKLEVCREFQRGACSREECRYGHPPRHVSIDSSDGMVTVCMDFMKGRCQREMCRYFHPPSHLQGRVRAAQQQSVPLEGSRKRPHDTMTLPELSFGEPFKKQTALEVPLVMPAAGAATALQSFNQPLGLQFTSLIPTMPLLAPGLPLVQTQVPQNTSSNGLPVCRDYVSGQCHREACRYAHVKDKNVEVIDGKVTVCRDAVKGKCTRPNCKYYHPTTSSSSSASAPDQTPR